MEIILIMKVTPLPSAHLRLMLLLSWIFNIFDWKWRPIVYYDGNSTSSPLIGCYDNNGTPFSVVPTYANNSGCLSLVWTTDTVSVGAGWSATINCVVPCSTSPLLTFPAMSSATDTICLGDTVTLVGLAASSWMPLDTNNLSFQSIDTILFTRWSRSML